MDPSQDEIKCIEGLQGIEGNEAFQDLRIDADRALHKKKKKDAQKQKGKEKETETVLDGRGSRKSARSNKNESKNEKGECSRSKDTEQMARILGELKEIKKKAKQTGCRV
ncbi:unnamed protein product [Cuscuta epithymum]|uniref:Uncharacterized protein n=1 Tax=Cuscuta epithymum TaxID=186058 RepID=A0AAV0EDX4_9ASTE|nr:unnamed protein product [Cuscuta epithymum]